MAKARKNGRCSISSGTPIVLPPMRFIPWGQVHPERSSDGTVGVLLRDGQIHARQAFNQKLTHLQIQGPSHSAASSGYVSKLMCFGFAFKHQAPPSKHGFVSRQHTTPPPPLPGCKGKPTGKLMGFLQLEKLPPMRRSNPRGASMAPPSAKTSASVTWRA